MVQNYKLVLSYDGTAYHGWQIQPNKKTIQGVLEEILFRFRSKRCPVHGAGRTDAGVHALGQVAHFKASLDLDEKQLLRALNGQLPEDIRVLSLIKAEETFHARKSAQSKIYQYRIINSPLISPFLVRYTLHWPGKLDIERMKAAAALFQREADFSTFSSNRLLPPVRNVMRSEVHVSADEILYTVEANGFLKYMVRTLVGTLMEVGKLKMEPAFIEDLFARRSRSLETPTAPAKGLCLLKVNY